MKSKCLFLFTTLVLTAWPVVARRPPNIVFFLSDDQRADFLGCAGHPFLKTPAIDQLAAEGVRFENAFVTTPICAASRATLFTGLWERSHKYTFGTPPIANPLLDDSYPVLLRQAGYRTGFVGKFGVGVTRGRQTDLFDWFMPLDRNPYWKKMPDGTTRYLTDLEGDRAIEFIQSSKGRPFCLSVSFNAAHAEDGARQSAFDHYPWGHNEDGLYRDVTVPEPLVSRDFWKGLPAFFHNSMHRERYEWRDTPAKYQEHSKAYFRMITGLDRNIGRVRDELKRLGLADHTVIIFMGDNGYYQGSRGFSGKWSHYEESLRVPLVIHDPRLPLLHRGKVLPQMALNVDVPATMLALARAGRVPATYQGRSLLPLLRGEVPTDWRTEFFAEHLFDRHDIPKWEGVRGSRYVYARYFENLPEGEFLHDLRTDPLQLKNLAADGGHAAVLARMRQRCDALRDELGGAYSKEKFPTVRRPPAPKVQPKAGKK